MSLSYFLIMFGRRRLIYVWFFLSVLPSFLKIAFISIYYKAAGKEELDKNMLKLRYMNRTIISLFPLMIGTVMHVVWDGLFLDYIYFIWGLFRWNKIIKTSYQNHQMLDFFFLSCSNFYLLRPSRVILSCM